VHVRRRRRKRARGQRGERARGGGSHQGVRFAGRAPAPPTRPGAAALRRTMGARGPAPRLGCEGLLLRRRALLDSSNGVHF
jgi:hypothetical protein